MAYQMKSFDEISNMVKNKEKMLASIPAIQPVSNKNLTRISSGFGYRIDPVYKDQKAAYGASISPHH
jgi:DNA-directed RNA polymerase subunit F